MAGTCNHLSSPSHSRPLFRPPDTKRPMLRVRRAHFAQSAMNYPGPRLLRHLLIHTLAQGRSHLRGRGRMLKERARQSPQSGYPPRMYL